MWQLILDLTRLSFGVWDFFVLQPSKVRQQQLWELPLPHSPDFQQALTWNPTTVVLIATSLLRTATVHKAIPVTSHFLFPDEERFKGPLSLPRSVHVLICEHSPTSTIFPVTFCFKFYCHILNWILNWPVQDLDLHIQTRDLLKMKHCSLGKNNNWNLFLKVPSKQTISSRRKISFKPGTFPPPLNISYNLFHNGQTGSTN